MTTRNEKRSKRRFAKQCGAKPSPGVIADLSAMQDAGLALLAAKRAYAWAVSPEGTPYGAVEPVRKEER